MLAFADVADDVYKVKLLGLPERFGTDFHGEHRSILTHMIGFPSRPILLKRILHQLFNVRAGVQYTEIV